MCLRTAAVGELCQFSVAHIMSVGVLERHHRPHAGNVVIQQTSFFQVDRIVEVGADEFGTQVKLYDAVDFGIDLRTQVIALQVIVSVAQVSVLVEVASRHIILQFFSTSTHAEVVFVAPRPCEMRLVPVYVVIGLFVKMPVVAVGYGSRGQRAGHIVLDTLQGLVAENDFVALVDRCFIEIIGKAVRAQLSGKIRRT